MHKILSKLKKALILAPLAVALFTQPAFALNQGVNQQYMKPCGSGLCDTGTFDEIGSSSDRWQKIYGVDLDISGVFTFGGAMAGNLDIDGYDVILDTDGDTAITNDRDAGVADDEIGVTIATALDFLFGANDFTALSGSKISTNDIEETTAANGIDFTAQDVDFVLPTLTSGGTDDYGVQFTQTLNDPGAAGGSDTYRAIKYDITATDESGWDLVYMLDILYNASSIYRIDNRGILEVASGGGLDTVGAGTLDIGITNQTGITLGRAGQTVTVNSSGTFNGSTYEITGGKLLIDANNTECLLGRANADGGDAFGVDCTNGTTTFGGVTTVAGDAALGLNITSPTITTASTNDAATSWSQTLNASTGTGGSDNFYGLKYDFTATDTTGWDGALNAFTILSAGNPLFEMTQAGDFRIDDATGGLHVDTDGSGAPQIAAQTVADVLLGYDNGGTFVPALSVSNTTSQVNYPDIIGAATGNDVIFDMIGSDTNIGATISTKGNDLTTITGDTIGDGAAAANQGALILSRTLNDTTTGDGTAGAFELLQLDITQTDASAYSSVSVIRVGGVGTEAWSMASDGTATWNDATGSLVVGLDGSGNAGYTAKTSHTFGMEDADTDVLFNFTGTTNSGALNWMEDEDYFSFTDDVVIAVDEFLDQSYETSITASVTQTQGQQALTNHLNVITVVANANDVVTMPSAATGRCVKLVNSGANTLQIFPASGDDLGAGVDTSVTLATATSVEYCSADVTTWMQF